MNDKIKRAFRRPTTRQELKEGLEAVEEMGRKKGFSQAEIRPMQRTLRSIARLRGYQADRQKLLKKAQKQGIELPPFF